MKGFNVNLYFIASLRSKLINLSAQGVLPHIWDVLICIRCMTSSIVQMELFFYSEVSLYGEPLSFQATPKNDTGITIPMNYYAARYGSGASVGKDGSYTLDTGTAGELKQDFVQKSL